MYMQIVLIVVVLGVCSALAQECTVQAFMKSHPKDCCPIPMMLAESDFDKCKSEMKLPIPGDKRGCCFAECIFTNVNLYANGVVNRAELSKLAANSANGDATWSGLYTQVIETCFNEAAKRKDEFATAATLPPLVPGEKVCHPISGFILGCLKSQVIKNCPAGKFNQNTECNELKALTEKCPFGPF